MTGRVFVSEGDEVVAYDPPRSLEDVKQQYADGEIDEEGLEESLESVLTGDEDFEEAFRYVASNTDDE